MMSVLLALSALVTPNGVAHPMSGNDQTLILKCFASVKGAPIPMDYNGTGLIKNIGGNLFVAEVKGDQLELSINDLSKMKGSILDGDLILTRNEMSEDGEKGVFTRRKLSRIKAGDKVELELRFANANLLMTCTR